MTRILLGLLILKIISVAANPNFESIGDLNLICSSGWNAKYGNCYLFVNVPNIHKVAASICKRYGSKLANPKDYKEFVYLKTLAKNKFQNENKFWIGHSKGEDNDCYGYWDNFQPNWSKGNCVAMKKDDGLYMVNKCERSYPFVCQKEACVQSFPCNNDKCVPSSFVDDGQNDCGDNSDERNNTQNCNYYYNSAIGEFTADLSTVNYKVNCIITIEASIGSRIILQFNLDKTKMANDYLEIWSGGSDASDHSIIERPIHSNTNQFYSKNNFVFVKFYTTKNVTEERFSFNWTSVAIRTKTVQATNNSQELKFPEGPTLFPNLELSWKIEASKGSIITLKLTELVLQNSEGNSLQIWYENVLAVNLTSSTKSQVYISNTNKVYIYLNTGNEACKGGFTLTYQEGCDIQLQSDYGEISSPGFNSINQSSGFYVTNIQCSWLLRAQNSQSFFNLAFNWFNLTDSNDFLEVYDNDIFMRNLTGNGPTYNLQTTMNVLKLKFISSVMDVSSGFNATFSMSCPPINESVSSETIIESIETANDLLPTVNISCVPGYVFKQEEYTNTKTQVLVCNMGGTWSKNPYPSCQKIACENLLNIENGTIHNVSGVTYGSSVYYKCNAGYFFASSNSYAECDESGKWINLPLCQPYTCSSITPNDPNSFFKQVFGNDLEIGAQKEAVCNPGYEFSGEAIISCLATGSWTTNTYSCTEKGCLVPYDPKAIGTGKTLSEAESFVYPCQNGCTIKGLDKQTESLVCSNQSLNMVNGEKFTDLNKCEGECFTQVNNCSKCKQANTAECVNLSTVDYLCRCKEGYEGTTCETDIDKCIWKRCLNGSPCIYNSGVALCRCTYGWTGDICQLKTEKCSSYPCKNGAHCYSTSNDYICRCKKGFINKNCDARWDKCQLSNLCANGGTCVSDKNECACTGNFTGDRCELEKDYCKQKPCKDNEDCRNTASGYVCEEKKDYFPYTDASEICRTVPCHGMKSISECQSCKSSSENFDIFFESSVSGGATLSRYATFEANYFSVCMKILFSDQMNSDGIFITLFKENSMNIFEEYLSIGSKGITMNSTDYNYSADLNFKDWSSFCVAISENGDTRILVRKFKKIDLKMTSLQLKNFQFKIVIGRNFYGYITKLTIFNKFLSYNQLLNLPGSPYINWANYVPSWGARFQVPSRDPIVNICDFDVDRNKCPSKPDKSLPKFSNCNTNDVSAVCPRLNCRLNITQPDANKGSIKSSIDPEGYVYKWGPKNVIFEAKDSSGNSATCRNKLFVMYKTCENPPRFDQTSCSIVCPAGQTLCMPFPFKLACSKLGVFNREHPFNDMIIPPCGDEEPYSLQIRVSFKYALEGVLCNKPTVQTDVTNKVKEITNNYISNYTGFCHGNCSSIQYIPGCNNTKYIAMVLIIPHTAPMIKRKSDDVDVSTTEEVKRLVFLQNVYKQIEEQTLGKLETDSIKVTPLSGCLYGYAFVNNTCVQCGLGTYYDNTTLHCSYCPVGHYQNKSGQASCEQCPNNAITQEVGTQKLDDCYEICASGFYFDKNNKNCTPCDIGFYQHSSGQSFCKPCDLGKTTYTYGSNSSSLCFSICKPGYHLMENGTCEKCLRGYYRQFDYQPSCISCAINATTTTAGSTSFENCSIPACKQGEFLNGTICHDCPAGTYQDEIWQESCIQCPSNKWTRGNGKKDNSSCEVYCVSGFEKKNATDTCSKCPKGFFRALQFLDPFTLCTKCPENFTTDGEGGTECPLRICPAGMFRNVTNNECEDCPQGYYQPNVTTDLCFKCPENYTTLSTQSKSSANCTFYCKFAGYEIGPSGRECIPCVKGYYKNAAAEVKENCSKCPQDFTTSVNEGATSVSKCDLRICPAGTFRNVTNNECEDCPQGYYQPNVTTDLCFKCPENYTTLSTQSKSQANCTFYCKFAGYEIGPSGRECIPCVKGYYKNAAAGVKEKCSKCPQNFTTSVNEGATSVSKCDLRICPEGTFIKENDCRPCANNTYQPAMSKFSCEECPDNTYTYTEGTIKKSDCQLLCGAGYEGQENCELCDVDYFKPTFGAKVCSKCPTHFLASANRTVCNVLNCLAGYYNASASSCLPCEKGKYKDSVGNTNCISCPNSAYTTTSTGSISANNCTKVNCPPGYKFNNSMDACTVCPKGTYQTKRGDYPCIPCTGIFTTFGNASTSKTDCLIPNCPAGKEPSADYLSCTNCRIGYYKTETNTIICIKCPVNRTTVGTGATDVSQCSKETESNTNNTLSTVDIVINLKYSLPDCESKKAFYEEQIKTMIKKRIAEMSTSWNLCTTDCQIAVSINCATSNRKKRATANGDAAIRILNVKPDTDSKITNEVKNAESLFRQDCKVNPGQYQVDSATLADCVVNSACKYSQLISGKCEKCPAGTKAIVTGCVDCPGGTYSNIDQRNCTNCKSPLSSKPRSNSSGCLAKCLVDSAYCKNEGKCYQGINDIYHFCVCSNKFSGVQCEIYNGPDDPKQTWIFVGIGCIAAILVIILMAVGTVIYLRKKREKEKMLESTSDEQLQPNFDYHFPMQMYQKSKPIVTEWKDFRKF